MAALLTIAGVVGGTRYYAIRTQLYYQIDAAANNVIQQLEEILTERPEFLEPGALDAVVDRFTYRLPSVARVSLVDPGFRILADSRLAVGAPADQTALLPLLRDVGRQRFYYDSGGDRYLRVSRSLRGRYDPSRRSDIVGAVSLDMRLTHVDAAIKRELVGEMTLVLVLFIPIGAAVYAILRRRFVQPLEQLADAGARFARGEAPAPLAFTDGDELEAVAHTFNDMVKARTSALRDRERQLADAQAIAHVGSWEWDIPTRAVSWSDELCRIYGIPVGSPASYEAFVARVHPEDRERVEQIIARGVAERRTEDYEWRLARSDGTTRHMHTVSVVVTDAAGMAVRMAGTSVDITERKKAEEHQQTLLLELQKSLAEVKILRGILPICASCKRVRTKQGGWEQIESYVREHTEAEFSHGICPDCALKLYGKAP